MEDDILSASNYIKVRLRHYGRLLAKQVYWLNFLKLVVFGLSSISIVQRLNCSTPTLMTNHPSLSKPLKATFTGLVTVWEKLLKLV